MRLENSLHLSGPLPPHLPNEEAGADQIEVSSQRKQSSESSTPSRLGAAPISQNPRKETAAHQGKKTLHAFSVVVS